jgi:hypothetical protein
MGVHLRVSCGALLLAALLQLALQPAHAINFRDLGTAGDAHYIALEGKFETGNDQKFVEKILAIERAAIPLESPGGTVDSALGIGQVILLAVSMHHMFILEIWFPMLWLLLALADRIAYRPVFIDVPPRFAVSAAKFSGQLASRS